MSEKERIRWAEAAANIILTVLALGLDAVAAALLGRRRPAIEERDPEEE